jgi:phosphate transport system protein
MTFAKDDLGHHVSQQFNEDLAGIHSRVLEMGGLVEQLLRDALRAIETGDSDLASAVIDRDIEINTMEVRLDEQCSQILARRQPAAGDLRLVFSVIKAVTDLERMGDQAKRVARTVLEISGTPQERFGRPIGHMGTMVLELIAKTLDAFARMDAQVALEVAQGDIAVDRECKAITRQLLTYMMEDPRTIGAALHLVWAARALERAGDHAKNIAEYVIYMVHGKDLRHIKAEERAQRLQEP